LLRNYLETAAQEVTDPLLNTCNTDILFLFKGD